MPRVRPDWDVWHWAGQTARGCNRHMTALHPEPARLQPVPDRDTLRSALELAVRAPSIHNTQPWRWRIGRGSLHLYADERRWLPATDPDERDLLLSCGAALHHARVALASLGWSGPVHRLPDPADRMLLATIELSEHEPSPEELALAEAIPSRRSSRQAYASSAVPSSLLTELAALAYREGARLDHVVEPYERAVLSRAIEEADQAQRANAAYASELYRWSGRSRFAVDGVPAANAPTAAGYGDVRLRAFESPDPHRAVNAAGAGELLVLNTATDDATARLRAGEATSAVLLAATGQGLLSCPLTQPLEIVPARQVVQEINGAGMAPQMVIRVGWPAPGTRPLPATPRRPVEDVLDPGP